MIAVILTFFISLVLLAGLLGYKIIRIRAGEILVEENHSFHSFVPHHINLGSIKKTVIKYGQKYAHLAFLFLLRAWIRTLLIIKRDKEIVWAKIKSWMPKKHKENSQKAVSHFLRSISEYKEKIRKISEEITEEEKRNI